MTQTRRWGLTPLERSVFRCNSARALMTPMDEDDSIDEISKIEARIEELAEVSERCRKIILASKAAIGGGAVLLLILR